MKPILENLKKRFKKRITLDRSRQLARESTTQEEKTIKDDKPNDRAKVEHEGFLSFDLYPWHDRFV